MSRAEFLRLVRIAFGYIGLWLLVAVFSTSEFFRRVMATYGNNPPPLNETLEFQLVVALNWAMTTPLIVAIAERLPLRGPHSFRNTVILTMLVPPFATIRAVWGAVVMNVFEDGYIRPDFIKLSFGIRFHHYMFVFGVIIIVTNVLLAQAEEAAREQRTIVLETALTTAVIEDMRARLQPQFLFATLDAIVARIRTAPADADGMIVSLSYLLRRSLDFAQRDDIALSDELAFIERYLMIQRLRFEGALTTRVEVEDDVLDARVQPFLLQPLVDDAVMSGSGVVEVHGRASGSRLRLEVQGAKTVTLEVPLVLPEAEVKQCVS
ncbi:MAG TPA: histidine kinase [Thermoanaerobaculia bacterium]|nr:histidine kinase [Thermoanaerobaculia bacterium]